MDGVVIVDRRREVNVWTHDGDVYLAVEDQHDRSQVQLNMAQAKRVLELLNDALAQLYEEQR